MAEYGRPQKPQDEETEKTEPDASQGRLTHEQRAELQREQAQRTAAERLTAQEAAQRAGQQAAAERAEANRAQREAQQREEDARQADAAKQVEALRAQDLQTVDIPASVPSAAPLRCRCGSTDFGVPQIVQLHHTGDGITSKPIPAPDTISYSCMGCGDTGTLAHLKGRLDG